VISLFKTLNFLKLDDIYKLKLAKFMYSISFITINLRKLSKTAL